MFLLLCSFFPNSGMFFKVIKNKTMIRKSKIIWLLKQILPLKYESTYTEMETNNKMHSTWRMWLGKPFNISHEKI